MDITVHPRKVALILFVVIACFVAAHLARQFAEIRLGRSLGLDLFDLDSVKSIPRAFSAAMLLVCSGLFFIIALANRKKSVYSLLCWLGLALAFLYFAITKYTAIHETLALPLRQALNLSKLQFYAVAYGIVAVVFPLAYLKFFRGLPRKTMLLLAIGAVTFVVGAFAFDLVVAYVGKRVDHQSALYIVLSTLEEVLEMGGVIVVIYTLLSYIGSELKWAGVRVVE